MADEFLSWSNNLILSWIFMLLYSWLSPQQAEAIGKSVCSRVAFSLDSSCIHLPPTNLYMYHNPDTTFFSLTEFCLISHLCINCATIAFGWFCYSCRMYVALSVICAMTCTFYCELRNCIIIMRWRII